MSERQYAWKRCNYCKFYKNKKCEIDCVPIRGELCYDKDCFLVVE